MSPSDAVARIADLVTLSLPEIRERATTALDNASFYQTAIRRVTSDELSLLQAEIQGVADAYGFPEVKSRGGMVEFDRALSSKLFSFMEILPSDAADEGVWSYLSLNLCPEVAFWRYPRNSTDAGLENYERWVGKPRNVLRRAWWRGYILGAELSDQLLEDEVVGLLERPSIGGNVLLARVMARTHLAEVAKRSIRSRQDLLREATKRLRRRLAFISVYALDLAALEALVQDVFAEAVAALGPTGNSIPRATDKDPVADFKARAHIYWPLLEGDAVEVPWERMEALRNDLDRYRVANKANIELASQIAFDLNRLIAEWASMSPGERAVVHAATCYFLLTEDEVPDDFPLGLDDDSAVVTAAFEALDRERA